MPDSASRLGLALIACAASVGAVPADDWRSNVGKLIDASGADVSVAMRSLDGRVELLIEPERRFHAASTMKVAVMIELYRQVEDGERSLDDVLLVRNEFASIIDGSPYQLDVAEDSDDAIYRHVGSELTLRELNEAMITLSSNLATNLLIGHLGVDKIRATVGGMGANGMEVVRGVEDIEAYRAGKSNSTNARALLVLMEAIAKRSAVSTAASEEMLAILTRQKFREAIPAGLPKGTVVAHKTGNITAIHHDAAIVLGQRPYVLVVLVRGVEMIRESAALIAAITRQVHSHVTGQAPN